MDLWKSLRWAEQDLDGRPASVAAYRERAARALRLRFGCSMASLWRLDGVAGTRALTCLAASTENPACSVAGHSLDEQVLPDYLGQLASRGLFRSDDTWTDPRLEGIRDHYLRPMGVRSLLDAAFQLNGRTFGVVCLEQYEQPRHWSTHDEADLRRAARMISLALGREFGGRLPLDLEGLPIESLTGRGL